MTKRNVLPEIENASDLPVLPAAAVKFNSMVSEGGGSMKEIGEVLGKDQAIVVKILKIANSAFFGLTKKVETVNHAVVILGINTVRNVVLSLSVMDRFKVSGDAGKDIMESLWGHSLAVAVTSQHLSKTLKIGASDDCFVGGLVHDVGKLVLLQYFTEVMLQICDRMLEKKVSFAVAEKEFLDVGHAVIGAHLAKKWRLPEGLVSVIRNHHTMTAGAPDYDRLMIVHAADAVVNKYMGDHLGQKRALNPSPAIGRELKTCLDGADYWFGDLEPQIEEASSLFLEGSLGK